MKRITMTSLVWLICVAVMLSLLAWMPATAHGPAALSADKTAHTMAVESEARVTPTSVLDLAASVAAMERIAEQKRLELGVPGASLVIVKDDKRGWRRNQPSEAQIGGYNRYFGL